MKKFTVQTSVRNCVRFAFFTLLMSNGPSAWAQDFVDVPISTEDIPEHSFSISCGVAENPHVNDIDSIEANSLVSLVEFAEENANDIVRLSVVVGKECAACGCPRSEINLEESRGPGPESLGSIFIDNRSTLQRRKHFGDTRPRLDTEGLEILAFVPGDWAVAHNIYLPRYSDLSHHQYRIYEYGTYYKVDGLFVARFDGGTGGNSIRFDIVTPTESQAFALDALRSRDPIE